MTTITGTPFEKLAASLTPAMQQQDMQDYLSSFLPDLSAGLTQMSLERPHDPHAFLARFLLSKSKFTSIIPQLDAYLESQSIPSAVVRDKVGIYEEKTKSVVPAASPKTSARKIQTITPTSITTSTSQQQKHPLHIIIAGAACSGKGTQCERIKQAYGVVHISTGDLLRANVEAGTELGQTAKSFMDTGRLVPDELLIGIVRERLKQEDCQKHGWLLDGFPRSPGQAEALIQAGIIPDIFIVLNVPDEILIERVTGRRLDPETGAIYHVKFDPAPSHIAPRLIQRSDDTEEKISVRLQGYHSYVSAIESHFTTILKRLDGNRSKDVVYDDIKHILDDILKQKQ